MSPIVELCTEAEIAELVRQWVFGWSVVRGVADRGREVDGGSYVRVDRAGHVARYVLHGGDPRRIAACARRVTEADTWIKAPVTDDELADCLPDGWIAEDHGFLMATPLRDVPARQHDGYTVAVDSSEHGHEAVVTTRESGVKAAGGKVAGVGPFAIFDQIITEPMHRSRGLGTLVMATLGRAALEAGADTGVLVATDDGRALYERLGWTVVAPFAAARFAPSPTAQPKM
ncbi:GNAT family N-acetyltransferase [Nocardia crassostreae]|uniref:GNAT family N-acetyltransferase n=1 Tax=Nocardia crassostreae TaxID=53428 RepID=UPI00082A77F6|nr:GNAT family N-acetyltransferase [Nocardia crassostreae]